MYKHFIKNKDIKNFLNRRRFIRNKLDNILSPATKEYLKLEKELQKELQKELKSTNNNKLKHKTR